MGNVCIVKVVDYCMHVVVGPLSFRLVYVMRLMKSVVYLFFLKTLFKYLVLFPKVRIVVALCVVGL